MDEEKLKSYNPGVDADTYLSFLSGEHFDVSLLDIDYENTTLDMSNYVLPEYWIIWNNKSTSHIINNTNIFKRTHGIFSFDVVPVFYQCYELQVPDNENISSFFTIVKIFFSVKSFNVK